MAEPDGAVEEFGNVLAALADPTRRRLLDMLAVQGAATATTLTGRLPISRQAIVKHLAVLDAAGLVVGSRAGREVRYALRPAALDATTRWMSWLAADWDRRLAAVKRAAETRGTRFRLTDSFPATDSKAHRDARCGDDAGREPQPTDTTVRTGDPTRRR
jgi:DNA-binding transcriptional ArsR family regulator